MVLTCFSHAPHTLLTLPSYVTPRAVTFTTALKLIPAEEKKSLAGNEIQFNYSLCLMQSGQAEEAMVSFNVVCENDAGHWKAHSLMGTLLVQAKRYVHRRGRKGGGGEGKEFTREGSGKRGRRGE